MKMDILELARKAGIRTIGKVNGVTLFNEVTPEKLEKMLNFSLEELEELILERVSHSDADGPFEDGQAAGLAEAIDVIKIYKEIP